ncbi:MAG: hypothetical protein PWP23_1256 [Candidatus Sumerlaeota bacterium]|nr:hypothetical protein [Candidatus Sumerlaeota bacterium]
MTIEARSVSSSSVTPTARLCDAWALALAFLSLVIQGHRFGVGIQEILLVQVRRAIDPEYLSADWLVGAQTHHPLMTALLALLVRLVGESLAFLLAHLATRFFLLTGLHRLCRALIPKARLAPLLVMVLAIFEPRLRIGSHYLQGGHFEVAFLGMAAAVWTLALGVRWLHGEAPWWKVALSAGLTILVHLFIGLPVLAILLFSALLRPGIGLRPQLWDAARLLLLALLIALPSLGPAAWSFFHPGETPLSPALLIAVLEARHPHHHMPWTWPAGDLVLGALLLPTLFLLLRRYSERPALPVVLFVWYLATALLFVVSTWFLVLPVVAYFQAFRLLGLLLAVGACGAAAAIECLLLPADRLAGYRGVLRVLAALALCILFRVPVLFVPAALFLLWRTRDVSTASVEEAPAPCLLRLWPLALAAGLLGVLLLQFAPPFRALANRFHGEHWLASIEPRTASRRELAEWVRVNTAGDDVFLIPPDLHGFRLVEQRPVVADWLYVPYENAPLWEWARRHLAQSALPEAQAAPLASTPDALDAAALLAWRRHATEPFALLPPSGRVPVARRFGATYLIHPTPAGTPPFPPVFQNAAYTVLAVPSP